MMQLPDKLDLPLDRRATVPLFQQIYARVRGAILGGLLPPGTRLPSSRSLASQLATSRATIEAAYGLLAGEGYIATRGAAGTIVEPRIGRHPAPRPPRPDRAGARAFHRAMMEGAQPFQMGVPSFDAFPRKVWSRLAARRARALAADDLGYPDPIGYAPLRQAIVNYLAIARGVVCTPDHVFITAGFQGALGLITRALMQPGDEAWIEDPGYFLTRDALRLASAELVPVPVDEDGIDVAAGIARAPQARFAFVTPSNHAPLGVTLALPRRLALLAWADEAKAWIVEDDYDSEFRYSGRPIPAMRSLDQSNRVLYIGTFSKVLFPGLRMGYLVVPDALVERFTRAAMLLDVHAALLDQMTLSDFLAAGHFARHIKRMRQLYAKRRDALRRALAEAFSGRLNVTRRAGGLHLVVELDRDCDDLALVDRARAHGLAPAALSLFGATAPYRPGLLLSFTNIPAESAVREARRLHRAIGDAL